MELEPVKRYPILKLADVLGIKVRGCQAMCFNGHDSKTPSLNFDTNKNTWKCYGACGAYGDNIDLVKEVLGLDFKSAVEWFEGLGIKVNNRGPRARYPSNRRSKSRPKSSSYGGNLKEAFNADPEVYNWFLDICDPICSVWAFEYADQHGISVEVLNQKGVREVNDSGTLFKKLISKWGKDRLIRAGVVSKNEMKLVWPNRTLLFPFKNGPDTEYIQGRTMVGRAKFINLSKIKKPIYNEQLLSRIDNGTVVHICEGVPDAIVMESFGFQAVAVLGATAFQESYVDLFKKSRVRVVSDGDSAGRMFWESIRKVFRKRGVRIEQVRAPDNMDVGDVACKERNR